MPEFLDIRTWSILQWVLVVLAAGFIGQFGKSFAQFVIAKVKAGRTAGKQAATISIPAERGKMKPETPSVPTGKGDMPPESSYAARDVSKAAETIAIPRVDESALPPISDKKALKAILKQRKKAAKSSAKASK
ncbi:MAG: hypothetical protein WC405_10645 [Syntrophales bacterium]